MLVVILYFVVSRIRMSSIPTYAWAMIIEVEQGGRYTGRYVDRRYLVKKGGAVKQRLDELVLVILVLVVLIVLE